MRGMSKKKIRDANKGKGQGQTFKDIFLQAFTGRKTPKRIGPTKHHRLKAQDTAIIKRSKHNADVGSVDTLAGPEGMRNQMGKPTYATPKPGSIPQPKGTKVPKKTREAQEWYRRNFNRYDSDYEYGKVDFKK